MTKDEVMRELCDSYDGGLDLTFETTISELYADCDPADRAEALAELGPWLNARFGVHIDDWNWHRTFVPLKPATLGDACERIASKARVPEIRPFRVCGTDCLSAGAFLAIRTALSGEGVPVDSVRPSTSLEPLVREHLRDFSSALGRIAPGALPAPKVKYRLGYVLGWWLLVGGFIALAGSLREPLQSLACLVPVLAGAGLLRYFAGAAIQSVSFRELKTFRDLTEAVVRQI